MIFNNLCDTHSHSNHSPDSTATLLSMCEKAKSLNLLYYACADHCECDEYYEDTFKYNINAENSYIEQMKLKERFSNLYCGVELGQAITCPEIEKKVLENRNYDFVIGSIHRLDGYDDFYFLDSTKHDPFMLLDKYFDMALNTVKYTDFDTLAHLSYPLRYLKTKDGASLNFDSYIDKIEIIFKELIIRGKSLEINTSGLRQPIGETLPNEKFLKLYKQLGGELITVGSDAHNPDDLAKGIDTAYEMLLRNGFKYITVYKQRKETLINIE